MTAIPPELGPLVADLRARYATKARQLEILRREYEDLTTAPAGAEQILGAIRAIIDTVAVDSRGRVAELDTRITEVERDLSEIHAAAAAAGIVVI